MNRELVDKRPLKIVTKDEVFSWGYKVEEEKIDEIIKLIKKFWNIEDWCLIKYYIIDLYINLALLLKAFNHSSAEQTLKYIGSEEGNITKIYPQFEI